MTRMLDVSFFYSDSLRSCHEDLRKHFEPMILASQALPEVRVFSGLTLRLIRLAISSMLSCQAGLGEESRLPLRSASQAIINLLYIMYVGPAIGDKSRGALAQQFLAYADVAFYKMLNTRKDRARETYKKRKGMTDVQFDDFLQDMKRLSDEAKSIHGCTPGSWHKTDLASMAAKVRDNAPPFVDKDIVDVAFSSFVSANSAVHGDALSLRSHYNEFGNSPLELAFKVDDTYSSVIVNQAIWAWKTIADYYNQTDFVDECLERHNRAILQQRFDSSPIVGSQAV